MARLRRLGIGAQVDLYGDGTHSWPYWQRELHRSWPLLMRAIGARYHGLQAARRAGRARDAFQASGCDRGARR